MIATEMSGSIKLANSENWSKTLSNDGCGSVFRIMNPTPSTKLLIARGRKMQEIIVAGLDVATK